MVLIGAVLFFSGCADKISSSPTTGGSGADSASSSPTTSGPGNVLGAQNGEGSTQKIVSF